MQEKHWFLLENIGKIKGKMFTKNDVGIKFNVYSRVPETLRFEVWAPPGFEVWLQGSGNPDV